MVTLRSETGDSRENKYNIRNVTVIGSAGIVTGILLTAPELRSEEMMCEDPATGAVDLSLHFEMGSKSMENHKDPGQGNKYLLNLVHAPRLDDNPQEIMSVFCIPDGMLIVVDCIEGITQEVTTLLHHAIIERIKPVLIVDISEKSFFELFTDGEKVYQAFLSVIDGVNKILKTFTDKLRRMKLFFFLALHLVGLSLLPDFRSENAAIFDIEEKNMSDKLWGDNFFDAATNSWSCQNTGSPTCIRGFVWFCCNPIIEVMNCCMKNRRSELWDLLEQRSVTIKDEEMTFEGVSLLKSVLGTWFPANSALLEFIINHLPSPAKAQKYRIENLYKGPLNDKYVNAIRRCEPDGPLMVYVSKMVWSKDRKLCAVGRVFSGRVTCGTTVRIMGPNHIYGENNDLHLQKVTCIGQKDHRIKDIPCGNLVSLVGLTECRTNATLTHSQEVCAHPLRAVNVTSDLNVDDPGDVSLQGSDINTVFHLPFHIYDSLYMHQREAVTWLWSIHGLDTGAILADDMGLGKSREVGAFLAGLLHSKCTGAILLLAPATIVDQWVYELENVQVEAKIFANPKDQPNIKTVVKKGGVLIASHDVFRDYLPNLGQYWDYVVVDEGHRIKNPETHLFRALKGVATKHRIIVTGTPIQNNLKELHTLMSFCCPKLLGDILEFELKFILPIDRGKHRDADPNVKQRSAIALKELKTIIEPFILRRTKKLLKTEGRLKCDKHEIVVWIRLTSCQEKLFTALVTHDALRTRGAAFPALHIAADVSNHPKLLLRKQKGFPSETNEVKAESIYYNAMKKSLLKICNESLLCKDESSCKLMFLLSIVTKLRDERHKILIFAQSPRSLDCIQSALSNITKEGCVIRMDGNTPTRERRNLINQFQASPSSPPHIFLMTSKVGGVGVTLTNASRVILFDPSNNPSDNDQSVDRAYRMGQTNDVLVYRLLTCATVEEHTYRQQILKGETSVSLLGEIQCKRGINTQDRNVLSMPPRGFGYCQTHAELSDIYGYEGFGRGLKAHLDQIKSNEFVIDITNHSLLFSIEENMVLSNWSSDLMDEGVWDVKLPQKGKKQIKQAPKDEMFMGSAAENHGMISAYVKIDANVRIGYAARKKIERSSGAAINYLTKNMSQTAPKKELVLVGTLAEIEKAKKHIKDFINENPPKTKLTMLIPRSKGGLLVGKGGSTIKEMNTASGAHIRTFPERIIKDHPDEQIVEITGTEDTVESAKEMIRELFDKSKPSHVVPMADRR